MVLSSVDSSSSSNGKPSLQVWPRNPIWMMDVFPIWPAGLVRCLRAPLLPIGRRRSGLELVGSWLIVCVRWSRGWVGANICT